MKTEIFLLFVCAQHIISFKLDNDNPVFGYITKYGIPTARNMRVTEESYKIHTRIVGGKPSTLGLQPYQVGLIASIMGTAEKSLCGGSLITADRVLTAAHCWSDGISRAWKLEVVLGSVLLFSGGVRVNTSAVAVHPNWSPALVRNDIAVVYLPDHIPTSATIARIALPSTTELDKDFVGEKVVASGFGLTKEDDEVTSDQELNYVKLTIIANSVCSTSYPGFIHSTNVCTSSAEGFTPCRGDSGGPLVSEIDGRRTLIGVTSFGSAFGCESLSPAVYTRVASYLGFIYQHVS